MIASRGFSYVEMIRLPNAINAVSAALTVGSMAYHSLDAVICVAFLVSS